MPAWVTPWGRSGWASNLPNLPAWLVEIFQTFVDGVPSGPVPPATTIPSDTASTAAPDRGSGSVTPARGFQVPSVPVWGSDARTQTVSVGAPLGPEPPTR